MFGQYSATSNSNPFAGHGRIFRRFWARSISSEVIRGIRMRAVADDEPLSSPFIPYGPWETHEVKREEQILLLYEIHIFARSSVGVGTSVSRAISSGTV